MKQVKLHSMTLRNFKGIADFAVEANGENVKIHGDNAVGKTTLFDAFTWLLFDKDSQNNAKFAIKTLNGDGSEKHNKEHTVEATFLVNGVETIFMKIYKEVWTKKRGAANKEFTGHTTDYFVDGVPLNKKEYTAKVEAVVKEETFKLLTSPTYFNENIKWQDRRKILLEICGDISDEEVIASDEQLHQLHEMLSNKSMEDMKKIIASRKKHINDELEKIPVRIDELHRTIPKAIGDLPKLQVDLQAVTAEMDDLKQQKLNVLNGSAVVTKRTELQQLDMQMVGVKRDFEQESKQEIFKLQTALQEAQGNLQIVTAEGNKIQFAIDDKNHEISYLETDINRYENWINELRKKWTEVDKTTFEYEENCECSLCKQPLPTELLQATKAEALAQYNQNRTKQLNEINAEGKERATEKQSRVDKHAILLKEAIDLSEQLAVAKAKLDKPLADIKKIEGKLAEASTSLPDISSYEPYQSLLQQKLTLQAEIKSMEEMTHETASGLQQSINELDAKRSSLNAEIAQLAGVDATHKRISQLEEEQQRLADEYESFEHKDYLIDTFTRRKVDMLNEKINSKFEHARFKLFDQQVNGALNEVCETLFEGVPYGSGLNNAARINVGLDIINTLSEHYGITAPIFIDNAEAVTKFIDSDSQLISLLVSEKDKQLRVETIKNELAEAI